MVDGRERVSSLEPRLRITIPSTIPSTISSTIPSTITNYDYSVTPDFLSFFGRISTARSAGLPIPPSTGTVHAFTTKVARRSPAHAGQRLERNTKYLDRAPGAGRGETESEAASLPRAPYQGRASSTNRRCPAAPGCAWLSSLRSGRSAEEHAWGYGTGVPITVLGSGFAGLGAQCPMSEVRRPHGGTSPEPRLRFSIAITITGQVTATAERTKRPTLTTRSRRTLTGGLIHESVCQRSCKKPVPSRVERWDSAVTGHGSTSPESTDPACNGPIG